MTSSLLEQNVQAIARLKADAGNHAEWATLRRGFHAVKGNCAMIGAESLRALASKGENAVAPVSENAAPPSAELLDRMAGVNDALARLLAASGNDARGEEAVS